MRVAQSTRLRSLANRLVGAFFFRATNVHFRPLFWQVMDLNGQWKLVYTSSSELTALLALSRLPFVTVGDITQSIDVASETVVNKVCIVHSVKSCSNNCLLA